MPEGYTLSWRNRGGIAPVDGSSLRPDTLGRLAPDALAVRTLPVGRERAALADLFEITGAPGDRLTLRDAPPLDHLGARMETGELVVHGPAGDDLGASMRGGRIVVHGNAGERIGGPAHTSERGMTGGEIVIHGNVGSCAGFRMRRGLIAINGSASGCVGYRMIAGTITIVGSVVHDPDTAPGIGMKRGTILCLDDQEPFEPITGFSRVGRFAAAELVALRLILRRLSELGITTMQSMIEQEFELHTGDALQLNRGELWQRVS